MSFFEVLRADMRAMGIKNIGPIGMLSSLVFRLDFPAVLLFRLSASCRKYGWIGRAFSFIFWRLNALLNACDIRAEAEIGPGLSLPHPMGVVIGPIVAGNNLLVHQNVTIGRSQTDDEYTGQDSRAVMGDDVILYAGAVIVGAVRIGNGARIGANAVVVSDVPDGRTAFTPPARCLPAKTV